MKKIIALLLIISCISIFASCGKNEYIDDGKALETAETVIEITGNAGSIDLDENAARTLLEVYDIESLGLSKDIYEVNELTKKLNEYNAIRQEKEKEIYQDAIKQIEENNEQLNRFHYCLCFEDAITQNELLEDNYMLTQDLYELYGDIDQLKNVKVKGE